VPQKPPAFFADLSGRGLKPHLYDEQHVHGSYLVQRNNHLLFGQNHLVSSDGVWSCESRSFKDQFIHYFMSPAVQSHYPGPKPVVDSAEGVFTLRTSHLTDDQVIRIDEPVFLATALEPDNYGRWITAVATKAAIFKKFGGSRKFLCRVARPWQRAFLNALGIEDNAILPHDPGRTYICADLITVEYSVSNMTISPSERMTFFELAARYRKSGPKNRKLFISRLSDAQRRPHYRVLQNETELAAMLSALGFFTIEPEALPIEQQIAIFAGAEQIVALGGAGIYNAVFCAPGTDFLTIEASDAFSHVHGQLLSSLELRYGMIFGRQDPSALKTVHANWTIDIEATRAAIFEFMRP
jgi:capsular polysaccharide biosynthesis protein